MGGKRSSKAPKAPDYAALAQQQATLGRETAREQTAANRPDQYNPYGSVQWAQDPTTGAWTQMESWDPRITSGMDSALDLQNQSIAALQGQGAFRGAEMPTYDPSSGQAVGNALYESIMTRARPSQQAEEETFTTRLRQQGLQPGTEAFDRAMRNLMTSQQDANLLASQQATMLGGQEARSIYDTQLRGQAQQYGQQRQEYQDPWSKAAAAQGFVGGMYRPDFRGFGTSTGYNPADMLGAAQAQYQARANQANANAANKNANTIAAANIAASSFGNS